MNLAEKIKWKLATCDLKTMSAVKMRKIHGIKSRWEFDKKLHLEGYTWSMLIDQEKMRRYMQAKKRKPKLPTYKIADEIGLARNTVYFQRKRWEKLSNKGNIL